jgi:hypothetical protein
MVQLDHRLLHEARRLMTGANVHRLKEMIFVYVQAVERFGSERQWSSLAKPYGAVSTRRSSF